MKRHVSLVILALTCVVVVDLHVDWRRADNGVLLRVGEQDVDVWGHTRQAWTQLIRRCDPAQPVLPHDPRWAATLASVREYSPPDSRSARIVGLRGQGDWLLAQVESDTLLPAVVTLKVQGGTVSPVPYGIWSGDTAPWLATPLIRDYLVRQVPELPRALAQCLEITPIANRL